ncbi:phage baseplate assembly protein V [Arthrobacter sp. Z4-13]
MIGAVFEQTSEDERESDGFISGVAVGEVIDNKDPDGLGRVRIHLPWQADGDASGWSRCAMNMAGKDRGLFLLPEVGDEVLVSAEKGDPSHLYVLGVLWNGKNRPPTDNADGANNIRVLKSRSGHTIRINDDKSAPEVEIRLEDGKKVALTKDGITVSDGKNNKIAIDSSNSSIQISATQKLVLDAPNIEIKAGAALTIQASGTLTVKGTTVLIN